MMRGIPIAIAVSTAIALSSCGGGNSGTMPVQPRVPAQGVATPAPAASQRTSVGTARLTLVLPTTAVRASKSAKVIHAIGNDSAARKAASTTRNPQFVDPVPNPNLSSPLFTAPVLDIYVDGTLIPNIDGVAGSNDSFVVTSASSDGSQNMSLPLYTLANNEIVVVEYDQTRTSILAIGETDLNGNFSPGGTVNVPLTMTMNVTDIGIVDLPNENNPTLISSDGSTTFGNFGCGGPASNNGFTFIALDANQTGIVDPNALTGSGSAPAPTLGNVTSGGGSHLATGSVPGEYFVTYIGCSPVGVDVSVVNPAFSIYSDVVEGSGNHDYFGGRQNGTVAGPYQGIYNLYQSGAIPQLFQISTQTVSRHLTFSDLT